MALILKDRVKETTAVTSTGTATLLGAVTGYQSFSVIGNGNTCYYAIVAQTGSEWEVGLGTYTSPNQLARTTVLSSSNSGSLVNFSVGTKDVYVTQPAEEAVYLNQATGKVEIGGDGTNTVTFTNVSTTNLTANTVTLTAGTITTNAANATDITNKTYVDGLFSTGVSYHAPVLVEAPTALNAVYVQPNGAGNGVGATLTNNGANAALVIDGVTLSNTARVLVYNQANAVQNGVYTVTNPGNASAQWVLTRSTDTDTFGLANPNSLGQGDAFFVQSGSTGKGETYICNTQGTITFGSTNITFAQISSAQIYAAGTGLNLANLTFSIANTTVVSGLYGDSANVSVIEVNAQGQLTSASNSAINVSNITVGTLPNARTTASSANGASTIVLRDSNGSFNANVVTATTVNATTGNFTNITANAAGLTDINASNITSGTISNARTTGNTSNSASTLVLRDASGNFGSNVITASSFSGDGSGINAINASNISSGTIANARTTASSSNGASTIVQRDSGGDFSANLVTASFSGNAALVSNINASNITSGTIGNAYTTANSSNGASTIVLRDAGGAFAAGAITGTSFTGNGSALTAINASSITSGTLDNARTTASSANGASTIVARDAGGNFSANTITATTFSGAMSGNGAALTNINASNISSGTIGTSFVSGSYTGITGVGNLTAGTWSANVIGNVYTTANSSNGASTIVLRDSTGSFTANVITANGSALTAINASNVTSGTLDNARTTAASANGASTIVQRDSTGSFTANSVTTTSISGNGVALTAINASNISSGTVATARLASGTANASTYLRGDQTWSTVTTAVTITNDTTTNSTFYPIFTSATSGNISAANVSSTELTFNPGLNQLSAPQVIASNGLFVNSLTVASSYSIPANSSAMSVGPITLANGVSVTVPSGGRWVVL